MMSLDREVGVLKSKVEALEEQTRDLLKRLRALERWIARLSGGLVVLIFVLKVAPYFIKGGP